MKFIISILVIWFLIPFTALSQSEKVTGVVFEKLENGTASPLIAVNVYWMNTNIVSVTDANGRFEIEKSTASETLIFSAYSFENDTIYSGFEKEIIITLQSSSTLEEVVIVQERDATATSFINPLRVDNINEKELQKAACCSLSESFETNPTIDVSFTDAVTGTRQIQMLGLSGPNIQITRESMPAARGFNAIYGLELIPGTWIESLQLNKGTGSVVNGFESIAGQINVEIRKPEDTDKFYLNLFGNEGGRYEANMHLAKKLNRKWSTGVLLHTRYNQTANDRNKDGFMDMPIGNHFFALNRWKYSGDNGIRWQLGVKYSAMNQQGGQIDFDPKNDEGSTTKWGMVNQVNRIEAWSKLGKVFEDLPWKSMGIQVAAVQHTQDSYFGLRNYDASQNSLYANAIYQSVLSNTNHKFKTGLSLFYDEYKELLDDDVMDRTETIPGAFFEYTYNYHNKFNIVSGIRLDHHNLFGKFLTPRLHLRYALTEKDILRTFIGRGQRTANIISENMGVLATSRQIIIHSEDSFKPYGLNPEVAWNYGVSYSKGFKISERKATLNIEAYRTDFENQIVYDLDVNTQEAHFYNLDGQSYSNSASVQLDYKLSSNIDVRMAYRWNDVKTTYNGQLLDKIFVSKNRAFLNIGYETDSDWKIDYTINWQDKKRVPSTITNPGSYQREVISPDFINMNAQISKKWKHNFELYLGVENLLNYQQKDPIIASDSPFSEHFDSSLVWGPIFGRNTYAGLRYRIR